MAAAELQPTPQTFAAVKWLRFAYFVRGYFARGRPQGVSGRFRRRELHLNAKPFNLHFEFRALGS
jgi:hypothetical protein